MFETLPTTSADFADWSWAQIAPYFVALEERPLTPTNVADWLADWSALSRLLMERHARLRVATTVDTTDEVAEQALHQFLDTISTNAQMAEQTLKTKLLDSGLTPDGMALPLRKMRADAELYAAENLPLFTQEVKLSGQYNKTMGTQTVDWEGETLTLTRLRPLLETPHRAQRRTIWQRIAQRQLADRASLNSLWQEMLTLRQEIAHNAGCDNYLAYKWRSLKRFDYTPEDSRAFHDAIETAVVPMATELYEQYRQALGVDVLRPWDVAHDVYPFTFAEKRPFATMAELQAKAGNMFDRVDPQLGDYFGTMRRENLLDLDNRPGKAPGGYCTYFAVAQRPFIFMNAVGADADIRTLLHEAGHAFHGFESRHLPYVQQRHPGHEFSEVASMAMELLAAPYLGSEFGGFFDAAADVAEHRRNHLRKIVMFWPYMAVVDGFQHWAYEYPDEAMDPANCDAKWTALWQRFVPAVDWSGYEDERATGWHRKQHIFRAPFYYVEYGMAQVGAVQVWRNALDDPDQALADYRAALRLGGTQSLPDLYRAAGADFKFDTAVMTEVMALLAETIAGLSV